MGLWGSEVQILSPRPVQGGFLQGESPFVMSLSCSHHGLSKNAIFAQFLLTTAFCLAPCALSCVESECRSSVRRFAIVTNSPYLGEKASHAISTRQRADRRDRGADTGARVARFK